MRNREILTVGVMVGIDPNYWLPCLARVAIKKASQVSLKRVDEYPRCTCFCDLRDRYRSLGDTVLSEKRFDQCVDFASSNWHPVSSP